MYYMYLLFFWVLIYLQKITSLDLDIMFNDDLSLTNWQMFMELCEAKSYIMSGWSLRELSFSLSGRQAWTFSVC